MHLSRRRCRTVVTSIYTRNTAHSFADHLVAARESEPDLGFMARMLALCTLRTTNPGRLDRSPAGPPDQHPVLGKFTHADAGQMHLYLNYAREHWVRREENPPVGLILCAQQWRLSRTLVTWEPGPAAGLAREFSQYASFLESTIRVTGPSLTRESSIMAPNRPVSTTTPASRSDSARRR